MEPENPVNATDFQAAGTRKIRYAVVGLGYIAQVAVLPAFSHAAENSQLVALVSSDPRKLKQLGKKYGVPKLYSYEQYDDCLASGEIDAVYIALPNSMHRAYTETAARRGIHVLCEKPMAFTEQDCESMIEACKSSRAKLMVAYRLHFEKGNLSAASALQEGKIGEPRIFNSVFSQQVNPDNSRLQSDIGGGPLYDIGIYCINAARYLFRAEPYEVFCYASANLQDNRFLQVYEMNSALLRFPDDQLASFNCSFGASNQSSYEVVGTKGVLRMDPAYEMVGDLKMEIRTAGKKHRTTYKKRDQFGPELTYFSDCILSDKEPEPDGMEGLADVRIIGALLESAEKGKPIELLPINKTSRPSLEQEIHKPALPTQPLVRATAPSE